MYKYFLSYLIYTGLVIFYLFEQYHSKIENYHDSLKHSIDKNFNASINAFELLNDSYYNHISSKMAYMLRNASDASKEQRDLVRYQLREEFTSIYNNRKLTNISSFHIFDKDGSSVLRFHKLNKHDDNLIDTRASLRRLSSNLNAQKGFEIGRYSASYRFQYPLFYDGTFVGSYEFGMDFNIIDTQMQKIFGIKNILYLHKEQVATVLEQQSIEKKYKEVVINDKTFYTLKTKHIHKIQPTIEKILRNHDTVHDGEYFVSLSYKNRDIIAVIIPTKDIGGKHIGFMVTGIEDTVSNTIIQSFVEELIIALLFGVIIIIIIYKDHEYKRYIRNIIDIQHNILIVTDGEEIYDANKKFMDFFGFKSLKQFKKTHTCICDHFVQEKGFLQKTVNNMSWFQYLQNNRDIQHNVVMYNSKKQKRYFKIVFEGFSHSENFILLFNDITEELLQKKKLEQKAYYDKLTSIYSRQSFDYYLEKTLSSGVDFSIIMFDIDGFKDINDIHGHDVGDSVLKELSRLVSSHIRSDDIFARWGGEEFMIIVNVDVVIAEQFANKLRQIIEDHTFKHIDTLTCSFGVTRYKEGDKTEQILKRADTMLYSAKKSGKNCVVAFS